MHLKLANINELQFLNAKIPDNLKYSTVHMHLEFAEIVKENNIGTVGDSQFGDHVSSLLTLINTTINRSIL